MEDRLVTEINGQTVQIDSEYDVLNAFGTQTGLDEEGYIEEWVVDTIDPELDYLSSDDEYVMRVYVYFSPLTETESAHVPESELQFDEWNRAGEIMTDTGVGLIYERTLDVENL